MRLYIATLIKHEDGFISAETFVSEKAGGVASKVAKRLEEEDVPFDPADILLECVNGNLHGAGEPLSIGVDTDVCHEYLLTTKIAEV